MNDPAYIPDRELIVETDTNGEPTRYIRGLGIISSDIDKARDILSLL